MSGKEKIVITVLIAVVLVLVVCNILLVEYRKIAELRQMEEKARIEREILEAIKQREAKEIAEFIYRYKPAEDEFIEEVSILSEKVKEKMVSVDDLIEITEERLDVAEDFSQKLDQIGDIPGPLETFYSYKLEFIARDIEAMALVLEYYESGSYSTYDEEKLDEAYQESESNFLEAEQEIERVYREYGLEYLLDS